MLEQLAGRLTGWIHRHPDDGVLLALHDGELSEPRRARALSHLEHCLRCRARAAQIGQEWECLSGRRAAAGRVSDSREADLLVKIQASIHAWSAANIVTAPPQAAEVFARTEAGRQMALVLGIYLGQRAAAALLEAGGAVPPSRSGCLATAESTLTALLGRRGTSAVEAKLHWIMEHFPESAVQSSLP